MQYHSGRRAWWVEESTVMQHLCCWMTIGLQYRETHGNTQEKFCDQPVLPLLVPRAGGGVM